MGSAYLAGLATGFWASAVEIGRLWQADRYFSPQMSAEARSDHYAGWLRAVRRVQSDG